MISERRRRRRKDSLLAAAICHCKTICPAHDTTQNCESAKVVKRTRIETARRRHVSLHTSRRHPAPLGILDQELNFVNLNLTKKISRKHILSFLKPVNMKAISSSTMPPKYQPTSSSNTPNRVFNKTYLLFFSLRMPLLYLPTN